MLAERDRLPLKFPAQATEVPEDVDSGLRLGTRLGPKSVTGLERDRVRKFLDPRLERVGNSREKSPALPRNHSRPRRKRTSCEFHRARDIFTTAARHCGKWAPVRWIFNFEPLA
jgi:hypothetical protein